MSDLEYKGKYLKYKNKYLTLKNQVDSQNNLDSSIQSGGNYFSRGTYVFFLNSFQTNPDKTETGKTIKNQVIKNFDEFTNQLGNCAYFLRVGSTTTGYDINHDFDTIYPNKSSLGAVASSMSYSVSGLGSSMLDGVSHIFSRPSVPSQSVPPLAGGGHIPFEIKYLCYYERIPLSSIQFNNKNVYDKDFKGFKYESDVKEITNLQSLVKGINNIIVPKDHDKGDNQISTILIINKLGNTTNDAEIVKRYSVNYPVQVSDTDIAATTAAYPPTNPPTIIQYPNRFQYPTVAEKSL